MNKILLFTILTITLCISCTKEDDSSSSSFELTTLDSLTHDHATELLRLNILSKYGGVFEQMEMYHKEVFEKGLPCDSTINIELTVEELPKYSFKIPIEVNTKCKDHPLTYNNRFFRGNHQGGTQTAESEIFIIEALLNDKQIIAGNFEDDVYTYGQLVRRNILITKGIAAELDPTAELFIKFPNCTYNRENISLTEITKATFNLHFNTIQSTQGKTVRKRRGFEGEIQLIDNKWTVTFNDGVVTLL